MEHYLKHGIDKFNFFGRAVFTIRILISHRQFKVPYKGPTMIASNEQDFSTCFAISLRLYTEVATISLEEGRYLSF